MLAGTYTVTVTDANGCTKTTSATVNEPPMVPLALSTTQVDVLCNGAATGSIDLTVTGGTAPYTYNWSNGATTQDVSGLLAGTYTVTVTDANGCTKTHFGTTITEPPALVIDCDSATTNSACGVPTVLIDLTVSGGVAPYTYVWSNGNTTQDISNLVVGTYTVTVTDANSCTKTTSATVNDTGGPSLGEHAWITCIAMATRPVPST